LVAHANFYFARFSLSSFPASGLESFAPRSPGDSVAKLEDRIEKEGWSRVPRTRDVFKRVE
jgi:hypothetical protein